MGSPRAYRADLEGSDEMIAMRKMMKQMARNHPPLAESSQPGGPGGGGDLAAIGAPPHISNPHILHLIRGTGHRAMRIREGFEGAEVEGQREAADVVKTAGHSREWFDHFLSLAHQRYNAGDFSVALGILQDLFSIDASHLPTLLLLGCTCHSLGLNDLSVLYNTIILNIDPRFAEAYSNLGTTHRAIAASFHSRWMKERTEEGGGEAQQHQSAAQYHLTLAERYYRAAIAIRPRYWDATVNLAGLLSSCGRYPEALDVYRRLVDVMDRLLFRAIEANSVTANDEESRAYVGRRQRPRRSLTSDEEAEEESSDSVCLESGGVLTRQRQTSRRGATPPSPRARLAIRAAASGRPFLTKGQRRRSPRAPLHGANTVTSPASSPSFVTGTPNAIGIEGKGSVGCESRSEEEDDELTCVESAGAEGITVVGDKVPPPSIPAATPSAGDTALRTDGAGAVRTTDPFPSAGMAIGDTIDQNLYVVLKRMEVRFVARLLKLLEADDTTLTPFDLDNAIVVPSYRDNEGDRIAKKCRGDIDEMPDASTKGSALSPTLSTLASSLSEYTPERRRDLHYAMGNLLIAMGDTAGARREYYRALVAVRVDLSPIIAEDGFGAVQSRNRAPIPVAEREDDEEMGVSVVVEDDEIKSDFLSTFASPQKALMVWKDYQNRKDRRSPPALVATDASAPPSLTVTSTQELTFNAASRPPFAFGRWWKGGRCHSGRGSKMHDAVVAAKRVLHGTVEANPDAVYHPTTSAILQTLAKMAQDAGRGALAVSLYYLALGFHPTANACNNLGILLASHRMDEAVLWYELGLHMDRNHVHLYTNLGSALKDRGQVTEGIACYERAITLQPDFHIALANLANVRKDQGRVEEAIQLYKRALTARPNFVEAFCNFVNSLLFVCDWTDRSAHLDRVREIIRAQLTAGIVVPCSSSVSGVRVLGRWRGKRRRRRTEMSKGSGTMSVSFSSQFLEFVTEMAASIPINQSEPNGVADRCLRIILSPQLPFSSVAKAVAFALAPPALPPPRPLPTVLPFHTFTYPSLTCAMIREISRRNADRVYHAVASSSWHPGQTIRPLAILKRLIKAGVCSVKGAGETDGYPVSPLTSEKVDQFSKSQDAAVGLSSETLHASHILMDAIQPHLEKSLRYPYPYAPPEPFPEKICIGYVSSDFNDHPLSHLMRSVFALHDRSRFIIRCYSLSPPTGANLAATSNSPSAAALGGEAGKSEPSLSGPGGYREAIRRGADHFLDVSSWSADKIAAQVAADKCHVLVDLNGYTRGGRGEVFAARPAPVQVAVMGYAGTMGTSRYYGMPSSSSEHKGGATEPRGDGGRKRRVSCVDEENPEISEDRDGDGELAQNVKGKIGLEKDWVEMEPFEEEETEEDDEDARMLARGCKGQWIDYMVSDEIACPRNMVRSEASAISWGGIGVKADQDIKDAVGLEEGPEDGRIYTESMIYMPRSFFVNDHRQGFREAPDDEVEKIIRDAVIEENGSGVIGHPFTESYDKPLPPLPSAGMNPTASITESSENHRSIASPISPSGPPPLYPSVFNSNTIEESGLTIEERSRWRREQIRRSKMRSDLFPGVPADTVIFANFNQLYKIDPVIFDTWLRVLARVPKSVLWLLRFPAAGEGRLRRRALEVAGEAVANRIIFTDVAMKHTHILRGRVADLFLDTPECNAHTTAADILWSGTPLLTFPKYGFRMCSRVAASVAYATGSWASWERGSVITPLFSDGQQVARLPGTVGGKDFKFSGLGLGTTDDDGSSRPASIPAPRRLVDDPWLLGHEMVVGSYEEYEERAVAFGNGVGWCWSPISDAASVDTVTAPMGSEDPKAVLVAKARAKDLGSVPSWLIPETASPEAYGAVLTTTLPLASGPPEGTAVLEPFHPPRQKPIGNASHEQLQGLPTQQQRQYLLYTKAEQEKRQARLVQSRIAILGAGPLPSHYHPSALPLVDGPNVEPPSPPPQWVLVPTGRLAMLRRRIFLGRDTMPLFDTLGWVRSLEAGLGEAVKRWSRTWVGLRERNVAEVEAVRRIVLDPLGAGEGLEGALREMGGKGLRDEGRRGRGGPVSTRTSTSSNCIWVGDEAYPDSRTFSWGVQDESGEKITSLTEMPDCGNADVPGVIGRSRDDVLFEE
ncbi:hypothetical protein HDU67_009377 [Dinochytrium kinnereticum]|nr:hypothetical protein HDU67_009377 [Dinochytrium kinnereticum]